MWEVLGGVWVGVAVVFALATFFTYGLKGSWTNRYTEGELVAMIVCWPITLFITVAVSLPVIAEKMARASEDKEDD